MAEEIINRLREFRINRSLTQAELAREVGVSRQSIISIEQHRYTPSLGLAIKLICFFNCSFEDMFLTDSHPSPTSKNRKKGQLRVKEPKTEPDDFQPLRGLPFLD
jgi:putative transcriptional regulator